jgi:hypothetical protein
MSDKLLEKYFEELRKEIDNENYIKELEETIEDKKTPLEPLVKKYY